MKGKGVEGVDLRNEGDLASGGLSKHIKGMGGGNEERVNWKKRSECRNTIKEGAITSLPEPS